MSLYALRSCCLLLSCVALITLFATCARVHVARQTSAPLVGSFGATARMRRETGARIVRMETKMASSFAVRRSRRTQLQRGVSYSIVIEYKYMFLLRCVECIIHTISLLNYIRYRTTLTSSNSSRLSTPPYTNSLGTKAAADVASAAAAAADAEPPTPPTTPPMAIDCD